METSQVPRILIADDDLALCKLLADYLQREGFVLDVVHDGDSVIGRLRDQARPDLVILDVMMPGRDGLDTLRALRTRHHLPVIMLSARGEPEDRVLGLELGADDYLSKPFLPRELLARIRAQLRRPPEFAASSVNVGNLRLVPAERSAQVDGRTLVLTGAEFLVLLDLARHAGELVDRSALTRFALSRELERFDRSIDVHVSRLRRKLGEASPRAPRISSTRGFGYMLVATTP